MERPIISGTDPWLCMLCMQGPQLWCPAHVDQGMGDIRDNQCVLVRWILLTCRFTLTGMPFAFKEAGFGMGIILLLLITVFTGKSFLLISERTRSVSNGSVNSSKVTNCVFHKSAQSAVKRSCGKYGQSLKGFPELPSRVSCCRARRKPEMSASFSDGIQFSERLTK